MADTATKTFTGEDFSRVASQYVQSPKVRKLVDALCVGSANDRADALAEAQEIIGLLEKMSDNGSGYTPHVELGFGSDNAAVIADKILGRSASPAETRRSFVKVGRA